MFRVPSIDRADVDKWPIATSGLPVRVANATRRVGVTTLGELRELPDEALTNLRSFGTISLRDVRRFFDLTTDMERGRLVFLTIQEVLDLFWDREELAVMLRRYGLTRPDAQAAHNYMTLQEIGNELNVTRERIRQVERSAVAHLKSIFATHCLSPFYLYLRSFLRSRYGVSTLDDVEDLRDQSWLNNYAPGSVMLLLHHLQPDQFTYDRGVFSLFSPDALSQTDQHVQNYVEQRGRPVPLADLVPVVPTTDPAWRVETLYKWLAAHTDMFVSTDQRVFLSDAGLDDVLEELLRSIPRPAHYRAITEAFNDRIAPAARKGTGYVLKVLNQSDHFVRIDRGYYDLVASPSS